MPNEMLHVAVRAAAGTLLFRTNQEAWALWRQIVRRIRPYALVLMPDHLHAMLLGLDEWFRMRTGLRAYALQRNRMRGSSGPVVEHDVVPAVVPRDRIGRNRRYVHLNPCRVIPPLAKDPLAWAFSTHRDAVGLALPPVLTPVREPEKLHRYVSADPCVRLDGTKLPVISTESDAIRTWTEVVAAVSAVTRTPAGALATERRSRGLIIEAARRLAKVSAQEIADRLEIHVATVHRGLECRDPQLAVLQRVIGDPRFTLLQDGDLRESASWRPYRHRR